MHGLLIFHTECWEKTPTIGILIFLYLKCFFCNIKVGKFTSNLHIVYRRTQKQKLGRKGRHSARTCYPFPKQRFGLGRFHFRSNLLYHGANVYSYQRDVPQSFWTHKMDDALNIGTLYMHNQFKELSELTYLIIFSDLWLILKSSLVSNSWWLIISCLWCLISRSSCHEINGSSSGKSPS